MLSHEAGTTVVGFPIHPFPVQRAVRSCLGAREEQGHDQGVPQALVMMQSFMLLTRNT